MRNIASLFFLTFCSYTAFGQLSLPPNGDNEKAEVSQWIGIVKVTITYFSPDVHDPAGADRKSHVWGELVHYGFIDEGYGPSTAAPWRAGANESTTISFSHDVKIDGKNVKAGTYALFLDLEKTGPSYWILSTNIGWGSFQYDPKFDVLRIPTNLEEAPYTEWLTYGFDNRKPTSASVFLQWENKRVPFKIEVPNVNQYYVDQIRKEIQQWPGFNYQNWQTAAAFCARNKINLEEALVWADRAIEKPFRGLTGNDGKINFINLQTKAMVLRALNRTQESDSIMDKAIHLPEVPAPSIFGYSRYLLGVNKNAKAMEVAKFNAKTYPDEKYWTSLGLARCYAALNDKKLAIKNLEVAIQNIPDPVKSLLPSLQEELKKLKEDNH